MVENCRGGGGLGYLVAFGLGMIVARVVSRGRWGRWYGRGHGPWCHGPWCDERRGGEWGNPPPTPPASNPPEGSTPPTA
jgi:hypothetical protein